MNKTHFIILAFLFCLRFSVAQQSETFLRLNTEMHTAKIRSISIDASGKTFLTVSNDKTSKLWDAATGALIQTFRSPIGMGIEGQLSAGALSPDGSIAVVGGYTSSNGLNNSIYIIKTATGEIVQSLKGLKEVIFDLEFSSNGEYLVAALASDKGVVIYKRVGDSTNPKFEMYKTLTESKGSSYSIDFDRNNRLLTVSFDGNIRLYSNTFDLLYKAKGIGNQPISVAFSPDGSKVAVGYNDVPNIEVFSGKDLSLLYRPKLNFLENTQQGGFNTVCFSSDGNYLYGGGNYSQYYVGNTDKNIQINCFIIRQWQDAGEGDFNDFLAAGNTILDLKSLPNSSYGETGDILFCGYKPDFGRMNASGDKVFYKSGEINFYNANDKSHFRINDTGSEIAFTPWFKQALKFSVNKHSLELSGSKKNKDLVSYSDKKIWNWLNSYTPQIKNKNVSFTQQNEICRSTDVSPDNLKVVFGATFSIYCFDMSGNRLWQTRVSSEAYAVNISENGRCVAAALSDGTICWYRIDDGKLLLTLYAHPNNKRWVLWTPNGYFDCSKGAENLIGWQVNNGLDKEASFYTADRFFENYYRPDIIQEIFKTYEMDVDIAARLGGSKNTLLDFKRPPLVAILTPANGTTSNSSTATVTVEATDQGGGVDEILLYQNNKLVQSTQRGFKPIQLANEKRIQTFTVELLPGNNTFRATAFNNDRSESNPSAINIVYNGAQKTTTLHLFVVGINKYKNATYNLSYAFDDAQAIKKKLSESGNGIFKDIKVYELYNENATKDKIHSTISSIVKTSEVNDLFLFFYAGHGVMSEHDANKQPMFFLVPYDLEKMYGNNIMLSDLGISALELRDWCKNIKAQKQVIMLDACQSGGAVSAFAMRGAAEEKSIMQLGRSAGVVVLSSTGTDQSATEFKQLGHGVFTYSILEGLNGKADGANQDKKITIKELEAFINDFIPELSKQYRGESQYPNSYSTGMDFPLGIVK